jgi:hypothetical protein
MELYHVTTIVKKYRGCKNVDFSWFRCERRAPRPYAELIENYAPSAIDAEGYIEVEGCIEAEGCIDEMFEWDEAQTLKDYIDQNYGEDQGITTIEKAELPIPNNTMGVGAIPVGGRQDFHMLDKAPNYSLPFKVWGYFDLRGCELVDLKAEAVRDRQQLSTQ